MGVNVLLRDCIMDQIINDINNDNPNEIKNLEIFIEQCANDVLKHMDYDTETNELSIVIADSQEVWALNKNYRGKDSTTNVLSFPFEGSLKEALLNDCEDEFDDEFLDEYINTINQPCFDKNTANNCRNESLNDNSCTTEKHADLNNKDIDTDSNNDATIPTNYTHDEKHTNNNSTHTDLNKDFFNDEYDDDEYVTDIDENTSSEKDNIEKYSKNVLDTFQEIDYLGDIIIDWETIQAEAIEYKKSLHTHLAHMITHSILHLMGYDHINDTEADEMENLEQEILKNLGFA